MLCKYLSNRFLFLLLFLIMVHATRAWGLDNNIAEETIPSIVLKHSPSQSQLSIEGLAMKRCENVELNLNALGEGKSAKPLNPGDKIRLNLFKDTDLIASVIRQNTDINGVHGITCKIVGSKYGRAYFSSGEDRLLARISLPEKQQDFMISWESDAKTHKVYEVDREHSVELPGGPSRVPEGQSRAPKSATTPDELVTSVTAQSSTVMSAPELTGAEDDPNAIVDVMFVYTPAAETYANSHESGVTRLINLLIQQINDIHDNSETGVTVNLIHSARVDYTETDAYTDLDRLTYHSNFKSFYDHAYMEEVPQWRDKYKADLVCLMEEIDGVGGLGWGLMEETGNPNYGYCLVRVQQVSWTYTTCHEFGHTMGAGHSKTQTEQPGPQVYSYSAGWQWNSAESPASIGYCTVMTYSDFDSNSSNGDEYRCLPYFSNPDVIYEYYYTGDVDDGNNALTIRKLRPVLAEYRHLNRPPEIVTNEIFQTMLGFPVALTEYELLSEDPDLFLGDTADTLTYTIETPVSNGTLFFDENEDDVIDDGEVLTTGGTFTQTDINDYKIKYIPTAYGPETDSFTFGLKDDEGLGPDHQTMNIDIMAFHFIYADEITVTEGDSGTKTANFTVHLTYDDGGVVSVNYATEDGTAQNEKGDGDYQSVSGSLTFSGGVLAQTVSVTIHGDGVDEGDEYFSLRLSNAVNAFIYYGGYCTIVNDDMSGIDVSTISGDTSENGDAATFGIRLSSRPAADVVITPLSSMPAEGVVSPASITFTQDDWFTTQTVTVTGQNDALNDGNQEYQITFTCASDDPIYDGWEITPLDVVNNDNDYLIVASMRNQYTEEYRSQTGGAITPSGDVIVEAGSDQTFTMTPDPGDKITDVLVNGESMGPLATYTFNDVHADATIEARFYEYKRPGMPVFISDTLTSDSSPVISWVSGGDGGGFYRWWYDDSWPDAENYTMYTSIEFNKPQADGPHTVYVCETQMPYYDGRPWSEIARFDFIIDSTRPWAEFESDAGEATNHPFAMTVTFNETVTGFDLACLDVVNAECSGFAAVDETSYRFDVTPISEGEVVFTLKPDSVVDQVGFTNQAAPSYIVDYDLTPPSPPVFTGDAYTTVSRPTWTWESGEGGCGVFRYQFEDATLRDDTPTTTVFAYTTPSDLELGSHSLYVWECDAAGNWSESAEFVVMIDPNWISVEATAIRSDWDEKREVGGVIQPAGIVKIGGDSSKVFTFLADDGYELCDVFVDGVSQGRCESYEYVNQGADGRIQAYFIPLNRPGNPIMSADAYTSDTTPIWHWVGADDEFFFRWQFKDFGPEYHWEVILLKRFIATVQPEGPVTLWIQSRNAANVWSEWVHFTITIDTTSPTLTLETDAGEWTHDPIQVRAIFNEYVREFSPEKISVTNGTISDLTTEDNITFTFTVQPLDGGEVTIQMPQDATRDRAGMPCEASNMLSVIYRDPNSAADGQWILME